MSEIPPDLRLELEHVRAQLARQALALGRAAGRRLAPPRPRARSSTRERDALVARDQRRSRRAREREARGSKVVAVARVVAVRRPRARWPPRWSPRWSPRTTRRGARGPRRRRLRRARAGAGARASARGGRVGGRARAENARGRPRGRTRASARRGRGEHVRNRFLLPSRARRTDEPGRGAGPAGARDPERGGGATRSAREGRSVRARPGVDSRGNSARPSTRPAVLALPGAMRARDDGHGLGAASRRAVVLSAFKSCVDAAVPANADAYDSSAFFFFHVARRRVDLTPERCDLFSSESSIRSHHFRRARIPRGAFATPRGPRRTGGDATLALLSLCGLIELSRRRDGRLRTRCITPRDDVPLWSVAPRPATRELLHGSSERSRRRTLM